MTKKSRRYYGMTVSQIGILAGVAVVALLCIVGAFVFILMQSTPAQPLPVATQSIPSTATSAPIAPLSTDVPTSTPAAVIATSVPPGGWVVFETQGATLWLPASFVGGDLVGHKQETINKINRLGKIYGNVVSRLKDEDKDLVLCMVDKTPKQTDIITTANVRHVLSTEDTTLDQYIQSYLGGDIDGTPVAMLLTVNESKKMTVLGRETKRLTYSATYAGHGMIGLAYYIKDGTDIWIVDYRLGPKEYVDMLPIMEQSIQTFNLGE